MDRAKIFRRGWAWPKNEWLDFGPDPDSLRIPDYPGLGDTETLLWSSGGSIIF